MSIADNMGVHRPMRCVGKLGILLKQLSLSLMLFFSFLALSILLFLMGKQSERNF